MILSKALETWNVERGKLLCNNHSAVITWRLLWTDSVRYKRIRFSRDNHTNSDPRVFDTLTSETNMDVEVHIAKSGDYFGHHSFLTPEAVERRRLKLRLKKEQNKKFRKCAQAGLGGGGGSRVGGSPIAFHLLVPLYSISQQ